MKLKTRQFTSLITAAAVTASTLVFNHSAALADATTGKVPALETTSVVENPNPAPVASSSTMQEKSAAASGWNRNLEFAYVGVQDGIVNSTVNAPLEYSISSSVNKYDEDISRYTVEIDLDPRLTFKGVKHVGIYTGHNLAEGEDYEVSKTGNKVSINFLKFDKLNQYAGYSRKVYIDLTASLTSGGDISDVTTHAKVFPNQDQTWENEGPVISSPAVTKLGNLEVQRRDPNTGAAVAGSVLEIRDPENDKVMSFYDAAGNLVTETTTDSDGKAVFGGLQVSDFRNNRATDDYKYKYRIVEKQAPQGYETAAPISAALKYQAGYNGSHDGSVMGCGYNHGAPITRYGGTDRVSTSLAAWKDNCSKTVVLAGVTGVADAFTGGPLAAAYGSTVIYTPKSGLPQKALQMFTTRGVNKAIILGGTGVVGSEVESQLSGIGVTDITRIAGNDRYKTAVSIAEALADKYGVAKTEMPLIFATGTDFADALVAAPVAAKQKGAVLLTVNNRLDKGTEQFIGNSSVDLDAVGGAAAEALNHYFGYWTDRVRHIYKGSNRFETAKLVAWSLFPQTDHYVVVNGMQGADGAIAGGLAPQASAPIIYTYADRPYGAAYDFFGPGNYVILVGGKGVLNNSLEQILLKELSRDPRAVPSSSP